MLRCTGYKNCKSGYCFCGGIIWPWQKRRTDIRYPDKFFRHTVFVHYGHRSMGDLTKEFLTREKDERIKPR